jgi:hypothetical protein
LTSNELQMDALSAEEATEPPDCVYFLGSETTASMGAAADSTAATNNSSVPVDSINIPDTHSQEEMHGYCSSFDSLDISRSSSESFSATADEGTDSKWHTCHHSPQGASRFLRLAFPATPKPTPDNNTEKTTTAAHRPPVGQQVEDPYLQWTARALQEAYPADDPQAAKILASLDMITVHQELDPVQPWMDPEQQPLEQILICDANGNAPTDSTPSDDPDNTKTTVEPTPQHPQDNQSPISTKEDTQLPPEAPVAIPIATPVAQEEAAADNPAAASPTSSTEATMTPAAAAAEDTHEELRRQQQRMYEAYHRVVAAEQRREAREQERQRQATFSRRTEIDQGFSFIWNHINGPSGQQPISAVLHGEPEQCCPTDCCFTYNCLWLVTLLNALLNVPVHAV